MMLLFYLLSAFVLVHDAQAAVRVPVTTLVREVMSKRSVDEERPSLTTLLDLTPEEDIVPEQSFVTASGKTKTKYHETFKGIPVYDTVVTTDEDGEDISGSLVKQVELDVPEVTARITEEEAIAIAQHAGSDDEVRDANIDVQEVQKYIYMDSDNKARLVYHVVYYIESEDKQSRPFTIIDALNGDVIDRWEGLDTNHQIGGEGGNKKTGKFIYGGSQFGKLRVTADSSKTMCTYTNVNVQVEHMQGKTSGTGASYQVKCSEGAKDAANGAYSPVNDALYFGGVVFDMFKNWYNKSPLKTKLYMRVHYGSNYENAFWNGRQMTFGNGRYYFYPLVSLDVTAHEAAHGFTGQHSGLEYRSQSGGMNEAFSDMAGEAAKNFMRGTNDFRVGYDIVKSSSGALRYMSDPPKDGRSIDHLSKYKEGIDVHYSSGIYNKAFYILASKSGWGTRKAFEIMVIANSMYWTRKSTFKEGACDVQRAAKDKGYSEQDVIDAFSKVGVSCGGSPTPAPSSGHIRAIACEHKGSKTISCPSGSVIYIIGANYGKLENICYTSNRKMCIASGSTGKTKQRCDGKSSCSLLAANSIYGDPCRGIPKYLDVKYACLPSGQSHIRVCEGKTRTISCPSGKKLQISYANYGRLDPENCSTKNNNVNCAASSSRSKVAQMCDGKSSCSLQASNSVFGDPCSGVPKYLVVKFACK